MEELKSWKNFDYGQWKKENEAFDHEAFDRALDEAFAKAQKSGNIEDIPANMPKDRPPWHPNAYYNDAGDILHVTLSDECSYSQWLTPHVSVQLSQETDEIVGVEIWGLKHILKSHLPSA